MNISKEKIRKIISLEKELFRDDITTVENVAGLFPRGFLSIVASAPGVGKTWFTLYITCQLSIGKDIFNSTHEPKKILILSGETGSMMLNRRLGKTNWGYEPSNIKIFDALEFGYNNIPYFINTLDGQETILTLIATYRPDIVFFDTLISYHSIDESKQAEMTQIFLWLMKVARMFDCAIVCNHHTRKRPADNPNRIQNQDDVIGSSAGIRLASAIYIVRSEEDEEGKSSMFVTNAKNWDKKIQPFRYSFITDEEGYLDFEIELDVNAKWNIKSRIESVVNTLGNNSILKVKDLSNKMKISESVLRMYLDEYVTTEKLTKIKFSNGIAYKLKE